MTIQDPTQRDIAASLLLIREELKVANLIAMTRVMLTPLPSDKPERAAMQRQIESIAARMATGIPTTKENR